jgi:lysyl-tRNA synthetase class 2
VLQLRAALLAVARRHFAERNVLEVETPAFSSAGVTDTHVESVEAQAHGLGLRGYLATSPEYPMKRLLAAGSGDIYQIARVFRDGESGRLHNPEFTLIEWYRVGFDTDLLMNDVESLLGALLAPRLKTARWQPAIRLSYREAMRRYAGVDPFDDAVADLRAAAERRGVAAPSDLGAGRDPWLDLLMSTIVGPQLGRGVLCFIHDYPASQAALARVRSADPPTAERFEAYFEGMELANGFRELADAAEQRARFAADQAARRSAGRSSPPVDERLLAALASGLPDCSGVALGFDRVVMLASGARSIEEVLAFPTKRA